MRLSTIAEYEIFIYGIRETFPAILSSTLRILRTGPASGRLVGILIFTDGLRLDVAELVDFDAGYLEILQYGYVVWKGDERLYWYDSQAHPHDPSLAATHPHHPSASSGQASISPQTLRQAQGKASSTIASPRPNSRLRNPTCRF